MRAGAWARRSMMLAAYLSDAARMVPCIICVARSSDGQIPPPVRVKRAVLAEGTEAVGPLQAATRSITIVFVLVPDPVGQVLSIAWRARGAMSPDLPSTSSAWAGNGYSCSKRLCRAWHERRLFGIPQQPAGSASSLRSSPWRPSLGMEAIAVNVRDPNEIERTITDFGRSANGGLIGPEAVGYRELIGPGGSAQTACALLGSRARLRRRPDFLRG